MNPSFCVIAMMFSAVSTYNLDTIGELDPEAPLHRRPSAVLSGQHSYPTDCSSSSYSTSSSSRYLSASSSSNSANRFHTGMTPSSLSASASAATATNSKLHRELLTRSIHYSAIDPIPGGTVSDSGFVHGEVVAVKSKRVCPAVRRSSLVASNWPSGSSSSPSLSAARRKRPSLSLSSSPVFARRSQINKTNATATNSRSGDLSCRVAAASSSLSASPKSSNFDSNSSTNTLLNPGGGFVFTDDPSSDSDTSSMRSSSGFVDYLQTLSACPDLRSRKSVLVHKSRRSKRTQSECEDLPSRSGVRKRLSNWDLKRPCYNFPSPSPSGLDGGVVAAKHANRPPNSLPVAGNRNPPSDLSSYRQTSESGSGTETIISDFESGTYSEDSLNRNKQQIHTSDRKVADINNKVSPRKQEIITKRLAEMAARFEREEASRYETDDSLDSSLHLQHHQQERLHPPATLRRMKRRRNNQVLAQSKTEIELLEDELLSLEQQLALATREATSESGSSSSWPNESPRRDSLPSDDLQSREVLNRSQWQDNVIKSWSTELFGNYTDNEKVRFSYENLQSSCSSVLGSMASMLPSVQEHHISNNFFREHNNFSNPHNQQEQDILSTSLNDEYLLLNHNINYPNNQIANVNQNPFINDIRPEKDLERQRERYFSMPEPVQSLIKHFQPVMEASPHDRYSPKPERRSSRNIRRGFSRVASSPSTPTSEYKPFPPSASHPLQRTFSDPSRRTHRRAQSLSSESGHGLTGAVGVTSMWIPMTPQLSRKSQQQTSATNTLSNQQRRRLGVTNSLSLARKVLLNHVLPSKAEGGGEFLNRSSVVVIIANFVRFFSAFHFACRFRLFCSKLHSLV